MYSDCLTFVDVFVSHIDEVRDNSILRAAAIWELHFVHLYVFALEVVRVVQLIVETNDAFDLGLEEMTHQVTRPDRLRAELTVA